MKLGRVIIQDCNFIDFYSCNLTTSKNIYTVAEIEMLSIV